MIVTTKEAINALDIWHKSVIEVMADRGLVKIADEADQQKAGDGE